MKKDTPKKLMTDREQAKMRKREAIAEMLEQGSTYHDIERELNASTSTIALVARLMKG